MSVDYNLQIDRYFHSSAFVFCDDDDDVDDNNGDGNKNQRRETTEKTNLLLKRNVNVGSFCSTGKRERESEREKYAVIHISGLRRNAFWEMR